MGSVESRRLREAKEREDNVRKSSSSNQHGGGAGSENNRGGEIGSSSGAVRKHVSMTGVSGGSALYAEQTRKKTKSRQR